MILYPEADPEFQRNSPRQISCSSTSSYHYQSGYTETAYLVEISLTGPLLFFFHRFSTW